jgi:hypothetical protein
MLPEIEQLSFLSSPIAEHKAGSKVLLSPIVGGASMMVWAIVIMISILLGENALSVVE